MVPIRYVVGDATLPLGEGPRVVTHVCNDVGAFGRGFAAAVARRWPAARERYVTHHRSHGLTPGEVVWAAVDSAGLFVAHMIAQRGLRGRGNPRPLDAACLAACLDRVGRAAAATGSAVHMPRVGCGLAGGSWDEVGPLVESALSARDVPVFVYDPPHSPNGDP